jgi:uncharacterized protein
MVWGLLFVNGNPDAKPAKQEGEKEAWVKQLDVAKIIGYPKSINKYVNDFAKIIDVVDVQQIKQMLDLLEKQTGVEVSIVTINSINDYQVPEITFEKFSTALFNTWGIGKKDTNNGILFLVAVKDHKVRIELGSGYPRSYDQIASKIIKNDIVPYLKQSQYSYGIYKGTQAILKNLTKKGAWYKYYMWHIIIWILMFIVLGIAISCFQSGKKGWRWGFLFMFTLPFVFFWQLGLGKKSGSSGGGSSSDSGDSGSSSGGFGGGSSSGGGASGGW